MTFEEPKLIIIRFEAADVLTTSNNELPIIPNESQPEESGWETPILPIKP